MTRKINRYSIEEKERLVKRMLPPEPDCQVCDGTMTKHYTGICGVTYTHE